MMIRLQFSIPSLSKWLACVLLAVLMCSPIAFAQEEAGPKPTVTQQDLEQIIADNQSDQPSPTSSAGIGGLNFLKLLVDGGPLMIPIALMSLLVVAVGVERSFALRTGRIFPRRLRREIRRAADDDILISPAELFRAAELFPSAGGRALKDLLTKVGRPIPEAESVISDSVQREAERLYGNVRWLTLAAAVTPLLGLLGTVWGMILAFYNTTQLTGGSNRVESLAEGIYVALVTTLAGLAVAIPAAILAHYFEGKITRVLTLVDVELRHLTPRLEQFEGKTRFDINSRGITSRPAHSHMATTPSPVPDLAPPPVRGPKLKA